MGLRRSGSDTFENVSGVGLLSCCQGGQASCYRLGSRIAVLGVNGI